MLAPTTRRFATVCRAAGAADRHTRFVRALVRRRTPLPVRPVTEILRALARLTWHTTRVTVSASLRQPRVERATATISWAREVTQRLVERHREHTHTMRIHLIERRNHVKHHHFRSLASRLVVDRVVTARVPAPSMTDRTVVHRVERPAAFPRVVQMTLRAPPVVTTSREMLPPPAMREQATAPRHQAPAAPRAHMPALPPEELSRVSNFVIAELDRRVVSFRERTGRL